MESAIKILSKITQDNQTAEEYLLSGKIDQSKFCRAVAVVESSLTKMEQCLLDARREIEKDRKYKSRKHWVIKTQFVYNTLAEKRGLIPCWISESKTKRVWQYLVHLVAEVAARIE